MLNNKIPWLNGSLEHGKRCIYLEQDTEKFKKGEREREEKKLKRKCSKIVHVRRRI